MTTNLELAKQYQEAYDWLADNLHSDRPVPHRNLVLAGHLDDGTHYDMPLRVILMGELVTADYFDVSEREESRDGLWTEEDMQTIFELILHAVPTLPEED